MEPNEHQKTAAVQAQKRKHNFLITQYPSHHSEPTDPYDITQKLAMAPLTGHNIPDAILNMGDHGFPIEVKNLLQRKSYSRTNATDYFAVYNGMLHLEEAAESQYMTQFNQTNVTVAATSNVFEFQIRISNQESMFRLSEAIAGSVLDYMTLKTTENEKQISFPGRVKSAHGDFIIVEINIGINYRLQHYCNGNMFDVYFHTNRTTFQAQHNAIKYISKHNLFNVLINNPKYNEVALDESMPTNNYEFCGTLAKELNEEQKIAAINIVKAPNASLPYLLFGPAGTGKTRTLVAAIEEIVRSSDNCVLVCANSNAACDEITERLLNVLHYGEMLRMYAKSFDTRKISENIKPISNGRGESILFPSLESLYKFRVVICTLTTACVFTRAREFSASRQIKRVRRYHEHNLDYNGYNPSHFSHIIIDEAASTNETSALVPIAGLCTADNQILSSLVFAGDPKQLDGVSKSRYSTQLGFKTSFMEHLFNSRLYQRNPVTDEYNQQYITQLVQNYRSHPAILQIPNALFYDNKLQAKASPNITDWFIGSNLLPSKVFPVVFKSVQGTCQKSAEDFSQFNIMEANVVIDCIKKVLMGKCRNGGRISQSDIGVVTPYKKQSVIISRSCRRENFNDVTVGTAEVFQGQERPVMIVSAVRTDGILGFVTDPRRLNVAITRAKALLILIGDPHTLCLDENWRKLIEHCIENNALIQGDKPFRMLTNNFKRQIQVDN